MDLRNRLYISSFSDEAFNLAREFGVGIEINHTCISEMLDDKEKLIEEISKDCEGIPNLLLHGPFTEIHPAAIDYKMRNLGMERLEEASEIVKYFNIPKMVVHTGFVPFIYFKEYQAEKAASFFTKFMEDKKFILAIENVLEDEPFMLKSMMDKIDNTNIKLCLDIGHMNAMDKVNDIYLWIKVLGKYITHFHLHNNDKSGDLHNPIFDGTMDILKVLKCIDENCNDVTFTIESRIARSSLEFLKREGLI